MSGPILYCCITTVMWCVLQWKGGGMWVLMWGGKIRSRIPCDKAILRLFCPIHRWNHESASKSIWGAWDTVWKRRSLWPCRGNVPNPVSARRRSRTTTVRTRGEGGGDFLYPGLLQITTVSMLSVESAWYRSGDYTKGWKQDGHNVELKVSWYQAPASRYLVL